MLRLVWTAGGRERHAVLREGDLVVGAHLDSDVRIPDPTVSRRHARLRVAGGQVVVEDLGSRNGTRVDGVALSGRTSLRPGQALRFGSVEARIEEVDPGEVEAAIVIAHSASPREAEPAQAATAAPTASVGSLGAFVTEALPGLLERLVRGGDTSEVAQAAGAALFQHTPCLDVEIRRLLPSGDGLLFAATRGADPRTPVEVVERQGDTLVALSFAHATQADTFVPLARAAAMLLALASPPSRGTRPESPPPPAPPDPPTVVPAVARVYAEAARVAQGDVSVLILGESGTGKELLARFIHAASLRSAGPFVPLNCAALPRDLLEAELFGIERGVATGVESRPGRFEQADGGTLFLDEIGDMAAETQARILRVLQEGVVHRVGGRDPRPARVRVLSATNRDIRALLAAGTFRRDLFHRVADWVVELPPLRQRRADIGNLAAHFLARAGARRGTVPGGVSRAALDALVAFDWPGNVRQLEREMTRAALFLDEGGLLETRHLQSGILGADNGGKPRSLRETLERVERHEIEQALALSRGDTGEAARRLGVPRSSLYRRIKELGVAIGAGHRD
ncbi:MAG: sigma 54-interacting transcriptional regulator [Acidobacteriota bacterium]